MMPTKTGTWRWDIVFATVPDLLYGCYAPCPISGFTHRTVLHGVYVPRLLSTIGRDLSVDELKAVDQI